MLYFPLCAHYLRDDRKRLLALAGQKFISDLANDAMTYSRIRSQSTTAAQGGATKDKKGHAPKVLLSCHASRRQRKLNVL